MNEYYKVNDEEMINVFVNGVESAVRMGVNGSIDELERIVRSGADEHLKRIHRRKIERKTREVVEPVWMNETIRGEIRYRRYLNRKKRRLTGNEQEQYWELYRVQKEKVKELVREEKTKYERDMASEVKNNRNGKKMWKMIDKLRGDGKIKRRNKLYEENGDEVPMEMEGERMIECWREIYQRDENRLNETWNDEKREDYEAQRREGMNNVITERSRRLERAIPGVLSLRVVEGVEGWM